MLEVTYRYEDSETEQKKTVTMDKFEFIRVTSQSFPEKNTSKTNAISGSKN